MQTGQVRLNSRESRTSGTTTVDGTLVAPRGLTIAAGSLFGKGQINATVISSGSVTAGDSSKKPGTLSPSTYTQNATGKLYISIGSATQYGQLAVGNGAALNGTLNITLINIFVPVIGSSFTILTGNAVSGTFTTVKGLSINSGEHFTIAYNSTGVTLTGASGP